MRTLGNAAGQRERTGPQRNTAPRLRGRMTPVIWTVFYALAAIIPHMAWASSLRCPSAIVGINAAIKTTPPSTFFEAAAIASLWRGLGFSATDGSDARRKRR
jgi:hypothetical protein